MRPQVTAVTHYNMAMDMGVMLQEMLARDEIAGGGTVWLKFTTCEGSNE